MFADKYFPVIPRRKRRLFSTRLKRHAVRMWGDAEIRLDDGTEITDERRLLRLFGCLAFVVEEAEKLGLSKTAIEARRAGLQLCYETETEDDLGMTFTEGVQGHG